MRYFVSFDISTIRIFSIIEAKIEQLQTSIKQITQYTAYGEDAAARLVAVFNGSTLGHSVVHEVYSKE